MVLRYSDAWCTAMQHSNNYLTAGTASPEAGLVVFFDSVEIRAAEKRNCFPLPLITSKPHLDPGSAIFSTIMGPQKCMIC